MKFCPKILFTRQKDKMSSSSSSSAGSYADSETDSNLTYVAQLDRKLPRGHAKGKAPVHFPLEPPRQITKYLESEPEDEEFDEAGFKVQVALTKKEATITQGLNPEFALRKVKRTVLEANLKRYAVLKSRENPGFISDDPRYLSIMEELHYLEQEQESKSEKSDWWLVTINPEEQNVETCLKPLQSCVERTIRKKWVDEYLYAYEQRSEDPEKFHGLHVHLLLRQKQPKKFSAVQEEIYNTCKHIVGNKKHIDVKNVTAGTEDSVIEYICGQKEDDKMDKVTCDAEMRLALELEPHYTNFEI